MSVVTRYTVRLELLTPFLGTVPKNRSVYEAYIQSKAVADDAGQEIDTEGEEETVPDLEEKGWTGFHEDDDGPFIMDYMIRGFLKAACYALRKVDDTLSSDITAYKKKIDSLVFVSPREIHLDVSDGRYDENTEVDWENTGELEVPEGLGVLERSLRAQTAQGERVTLARSDCAPPGTVLEFDISLLGNDITEEILREWFWYGRYKGLGQWRSGGYGSFDYQIEAVEE